VSRTGLGSGPLPSLSLLRVSRMERRAVNDGIRPDPRVFRVDVLRVTASGDVGERRYTGVDSPSTRYADLYLSPDTL